jgi:hypothetical protein
MYSLDANPGVHLKSIPPKLSRCLTVLALLWLLGETPMRLYGHLRWIETMQVNASDSDLLAFLEIALGQAPFLLTLGLHPSFFRPSTKNPFTEFPPLLGETSILLAGRSLGGCGG